MSFNPILSQKELAKSFLFGTKRPNIEPGIAIVLFRQNGQIVALSEGDQMTAGDFAWGNYKGYYEVDIASHNFSFQIEIPCNKDAYNFQADVQVDFSIIDPAQIVKNQLKDVHSLLQPEIVKIMRNVSRKYSAEQSEEAEDEINQNFANGLKFRGVFANRIVTNLKLEEASREHLRTMKEIENQKQLEEADKALQKLREEKDHELASMRDGFELERKKMKMKFYGPLIQKGQWQLLALHLAENPDDVATISQMISQQQQQDLENQLATLKLMLEEDVIEGFQVEEVGKRVLQRLVDTMGPLNIKALGDSSAGKSLPSPKRKSRKGKKEKRVDESEKGTEADENSNEKGTDAAEESK